MEQNMEDIKLFDTSLEVLADEIEMKPVLASGPGGQHINKTSSAIQVYHSRSGIRFKVQDTRDQFENRKIALTRLAEKLQAKNEKALLEKADERRRKRDPGASSRTF